MSTIFDPATYHLCFDTPVAWPIYSISQPRQPRQRRTITEDAFAYARQRYAETLWLPNSVAPLGHLVRTLRQPRLFTCDVLSPLLGSARAIAERFQGELPPILEANIPDDDEPAMWTAWQNVPDGTNIHAYLEKIEQREVQIQVLIHLLNLSLPPPPLTPSRKRKHGRSSRLPTDGLPSVEERLEFFMDKLSMWQLTASLAAQSSQQSSQQETHHDIEPDSSGEKDWTQQFCEDVVEPLFKNVLPEQCALLRSKLFRTPPSERKPSRSPSPVVFSRGGSRGPTPGPDTLLSRAASPLRAEDLRRSDGPNVELPRKLSVAVSTGQRDRSRSRSVSVVADEISAKGASRGGIVSSRALFKNREMPVRTSGSALQRASSSSSLPALQRTKSMPSTTTSLQHVMGEVLVPDTPAKRIKIEASTPPEWRVPESPVAGNSQTLDFSLSQYDDEDSDASGLKCEVLAFETPTKPNRR